MVRFKHVVEAWQKASPEHIHPLRSLDETLYWKSGEAQAKDAARWAPDGGTILDFGCGDGRLAIPLAKLGYQVLAVDASLDMLMRLKQRARNRKGGLTINTYRSDGLDLTDLISQPVDVVVARAVLIHHSHDDVATLVRELSTVLKRGGHLVADWPTGPHHERTDWIDVTTWTPEHRLSVATAAGLELVEDSTPSVWKKR